MVVVIIALECAQAAARTGHKAMIVYRHTVNHRALNEFKPLPLIRIILVCCIEGMFLPRIINIYNPWFLPASPQRFLLTTLPTCTQYVSIFLSLRSLVACSRPSRGQLHLTDFLLQLIDTTSRWVRREKFGWCKSDETDESRSVTCNPPKADFTLLLFIFLFPKPIS